MSARKTSATSPGKRCGGVVLWSVLFTCFTLLADPVKTVPEAVVPAATVNLGEIAQRAPSDVSLLAAIETNETPDAVFVGIRGVLPELTSRITLLLAEDPRSSLSLDNLRDRKITWSKLAATLEKQATQLYARSQALDAADVRIVQAQTLWSAAGKMAAAAGAPPETLNASQFVLQAAEAAATRVRTRRNAVLEVQSRVGDLQEKVRQALSVVNAAEASAIRTLRERDSAPLWSADAPESAVEAAANGRLIEVQRAASINYVQNNGAVFGLHSLVFIALVALFYWLRHVVRRWTETEPHLQESLPIFDVPIAAALALSFLIKSPLYADAPSLLRGILGAIIILPTIVILRRLLEPSLHRIPHALFIFYVLDQVQVGAAAFPRFCRLIFSLQMLGACAVFIWLAWTARSFLARSRSQDSEVLRRRKVTATWLQPLFWLAALLSIAAFLAGAFGYLRLGTLLGGATLRSGYVGVIFFALHSIFSGLLLVILRVRPASRLHVIIEHRTKVERQVNRLLFLVALGLWVWVSLELFGLQNDFQILLATVFDQPIGSKLTVGHLLGFFVAIWLSILVSRVVRFFLAEEVYQRVQLSPGLPYAISAMVNYGVLLVGFIVALSLLRIDLTKVTIIVSAFSVGLGFGLQNVINNFVSGIILLFERPIRVGDIVQIGDASGEVRRIGIRASIIRLPDGADLIVPNGNLISNPVTNWTYSDRSRAVEIALTVDAAPSHSEHVLGVLRKVATAQTSAQGNVKTPQVFITGLTGGKLNITVRAWSGVYENSTLLRSDLASALFKALAQENIGLV